MGKILYINIVKPNVDFNIDNTNTYNTDDIVYKTNSDDSFICDENYFLEMNGKTGKEVKEIIDNEIIDISLNMGDRINIGPDIEIYFILQIACIKYPDCIWYVYRV